MENPSKKHSKMNGGKYKRIMRHVTKLFHGKTISSSPPRRSQKGRSNVSEATEIENQVYAEKEYSSPVKEELHTEPQYSTIKEVAAVVHECVRSESSSNTIPPSPPPPIPKDIEALYTKVKKKHKKTEGNILPSVHLESIPSTSRTSKLLSSLLVHQSDVNHNVADHIPVKEIQQADLHSSVPDIQTNVDELQTWSSLRHQQHTKLPNRAKLMLRKVDVSHRVENISHKQATILKKDISSEHSSHPSQLNFPTASGKSARYTHHRSLDDFSSLAAHKEDTVNKIWQECQEEMIKLQHKTEHVVEENKILHHNIHILLQKEAKWKEEKGSILIHKQENHLLSQKNNVLMQELSALQEQNEKEVKHMSYQVQRLQTEKNNLLEKLHSTLHEKDTLETKYSRMCERNSEVVSYEVYGEAIQENQRLLNDLRTKHKKDMDRILESCRDVENEKNDLSVQVQTLKDDFKKVVQNNSALKGSLEEAVKNKDLIFSQLEQSKTQCLELQDLLLSLLKLAEEAITERDIALTKAEFQEKQQTLIQGTVVEHSIGIGRLQEHILNTRKRVNEEIRNSEMRSFR